MIELNPLSIFTTVVYVLILYVFMNRFFFGPILKILHERRELIAGRLEDAQKRMIEVDARTADYESAIRNARAEGYRRQEVSREAAMSSRAEVVSKAKAEADKTLQSTKAKLQDEASIAKKRLETEADRLAEDLSVALLKD